jgi:LacI family transcriptional regulator, galactose operon repressor
MKKSVGLLEIAKLANVSLGTVDRAIHNRGRIGDDTRRRVLNVAQQLGYRPNLAARALSRGPDSISVAVCIPREIRYYFDQLREGIRDEARHFEHLGLQVKYAAMERLGVGEASAVQASIDQQPQGLIIVPGDTEAITPLINEAEKRNIRVVCLDSDAPLSLRTTAVCADAEVGGRLAAELLGRFVPPASEAAVVTGDLHNGDHRRRVAGFTDLFQRICPDGKVVETVEDHESEEESFQKCCRMLKMRNTIAGLYVSTANCLPVCRAVTALGLSHKIKLIASDLFLEMAPYFDMGVIAASIYARPFAQGRMAVRLLVEHLLYGRRIRSKYYVSPQVVTRSTMHLFREGRSLQRRDQHDGGE